MKKRNKKILLQTGLVITLIFLISLIICVLFVIRITENIIVSSKREPMKNDISEIDQCLSFETKSESSIKYMLEHSSELSYDSFAVDEDKDYLVYGTDEETHRNKFETYTPEDQSILANYYYSLDNFILIYLLENSFYNDYCSVVLDSQGEARVLLSYSKNKEHIYNLGEIYGENLADIKPVKNILEDDYIDFTYELKGEFLSPDIYVYFPFKDESGNIVSIGIFHYYMDDIISYVIQESFEISIIAIVLSLILLDFIVLLFLRKKATKPLLSIKSSLHDYMENKQSADVVERMSKIKAKNELGVLSEDVSTLAVELDTYAIDNIKLAQNKERVKAELSLASEIQDDSLIKDFPDNDNIKICASMTPAKEVGGDFYDFFYIDDSHVALTIADVSGKGIPAALVMMSAMTSIRNYTMLLSDPAEILEKLNDKLCLRNNTNMFVTAWLGILDLKTGLLTTSNAGHEFPAVNTNGKYELFKDKHGFVLGGMPGMKYKNEEIRLKPGNSIFVYTDGVPEATNVKNELFGTDRMISALNTSESTLPEDALENVKKAVDDFIGTAQQFDDLTMLCIKFKGKL